MKQSTLFVKDMSLKALNYLVNASRGTLLSSGDPAIYYFSDGDSLLELMDEYELFPTKSGHVKKPVYSIMINDLNCVSDFSSEVRPRNTGILVQEDSIVKAVLRAYSYSRLDPNQFRVYQGTHSTISPNDLSVTIPSRFVK